MNKIRISMSKGEFVFLIFFTAVILFPGGLLLHKSDIKEAKLTATNIILTEENTQLKKQLKLAREAHIWIPVIEKMTTERFRDEMNVLAEILNQQEKKQ